MMNKIDCDIIMPVWNQLEFTRDCLDSIRDNPPHGSRFIFIDNASDGDTRKYLEGIKELGGNPVELVRNEKNLGFVKAVNQGMAKSGAPYICILNNDTIVTEGWLDEMIKVAEAQKDIGIVNPSSNNLGQKPAPGEPIALYARKFKGESGKFAELGAAIGFCMLIKRRVLEKIGAFDEIYGMGNFEDTDFSRRAIKEGFKCVRARGAYVYHRENSSFNRVKSFDEDFKRNKEIYEFRWGKPKRVAYILDSYDDNTLKRLELDSMKLARNGNWVWYFSHGSMKLPGHSNIVSVELPVKNFYLAVIFRILKKKKKFDEIYVGDERFGRVLDKLSFMHKARINYY